MIPLHKVHMPKEAGEMVNDTLYSGYIAEGEKTLQFEKQMGEYLGNPSVAAVNSCTSAITLSLAMEDIGPGDEVITTPMTCLSYMDTVLLADGRSTLPIGKIVNQRMPIDVLSLDEQTGRLVSKKVVGYIKKPVAKNAEWYRVSYRHARRSRGKYGVMGSWLTPDHRVLTKSGFKRIDSLHPLDKIATWERVLTDSQMSFVSGCLLGDGHITPHKKGKGQSRFTTCNTREQYEWLMLKKSALKGMHTHIYDVPERISKNKTSKAAAAFYTDSQTQWNQLRDKWYIDGKKHVPEDLILDVVSLCTWYLDDGCLVGNAAVLSAEGFCIKSREVLVSALNRLGLKAIHRVSRREIYIGNGIDEENSADHMFLMIAPLVPPCMRYKLPAKFRDYPYQPDLWDLGWAQTLFDDCIVVKGCPPKNHKPAYSYCIEVADTHNFITSGVVVSNCMATNIPIVSEGASIVWADIDPSTGNISPEDIERKITKKTSAILYVHWAGQPGDIARICEIGKRYGIPIIEDAAHALGATYDGKKVGNHGDYVCYSFQAIKHITTSDGGLITLNGDNVEERLDRLIKKRWFGLNRKFNRSPTKWEADIVDVGYKMHMNDVMATIGLSQLPYVEEIISKHRDNSLWYDAHLRNFPGITLIKRDSRSQTAAWIYSLLLDSSEEREKFSKHLNGHGIACNVVHVRNDRYSVFEDFTTTLPGVDDFCSRMINIPCGWWVTDEDRNRILNVIRMGW